MGKPSNDGNPSVGGSAGFSGNVEKIDDSVRENLPNNAKAYHQKNNNEGDEPIVHAPSQESANTARLDHAQTEKLQSTTPLWVGDTHAVISRDGPSYSVDHKQNRSHNNGSGRSRTTRRPGRIFDSQIVDRQGIVKPDRNAGEEPCNPVSRITKKKAKSARRNNSAPAQARKNNLYAALDLGTNNCRLLIAEPEQRGKFRVVDAFSRIVRLGEGLEKSGVLNDDAMDRAIDALIICGNKLKSANIQRQRLIATEACRRALNGAKFISRAKARTGLDLEIVDRKTEAHLAAEGCCSLIDRNADGAVLFDIGGGSSELVLLDCNQGNRNKISELIAGWTSLPIGVVTLSERHGGQEVTPQIFRQMVEDVEAHLDEFEERNKLADIWRSGKVHLLGTSGTVTTLAGVHLNLKRYDRRKVDGTWLEEIQVEEITKKLLAMNFDQRAQNPCIGRDRADLVLAGCAILQGIRNTWPAPRLRVADRGLREGLLMQMMESDGVWSGHNKGKKHRRGRGRRRNKANGLNKNMLRDDGVHPHKNEGRN